MTDSQRTRFATIYSETYERVLGYAMRRCDLPEDAADVVAETYMVAWRRVDRLPSGDETMPWLYSVARRVLANHRRGERRRRTRNAELGADLARLYGTVSHPRDRAELGDVGRVFRDLSDDDRELLSLVAWEGLNRDEIARVLGCSRNAVSIRLHRARKRFSRALVDAGIEVTGGHTMDVRIAEGKTA